MKSFGLVIVWPYSTGFLGYDLSAWRYRCIYTQYVKSVIQKETNSIFSIYSMISLLLRS